MRPLLYRKIWGFFAFVSIVLTAAETAQAITCNERHVLDQLQSIGVPTPLEAVVLDELNFLDPNELSHTLAQMGGQPFATAFLEAEFSNRQFIRTLYNPLRSIILEDPYACPCWHIIDGYLQPWISVSTGQFSIKGNRNGKGITFNDYAVSVGVQGTLWDLWTIGTAATFEQDNVHYKVGGTSRNNVFLGALYGLYRPDYFYFLWDFVAGRGNHELKRRIDLFSFELRPRSTLKVYQGMGYVELGKDFTCGIMVVQPFIGFEAGYYQYSGLGERNANPLNLNLHNKSQSLAYSRLGFHFSTLPIPCRAIMSIDIAWDCRLTGFHNTFGVNFDDFGDSFSIRGFTPNRNSIDGAISIFKEFDCGWEFFVEASGQYWGNAGSYTLLTGILSDW